MRELIGFLCGVAFVLWLIPAYIAALQVRYDRIAYHEKAQCTNNKETK